MDPLEPILQAVHHEVERAMSKHPHGFHSAHEGHSVIREELDELWDHVRADSGRSQRAMNEAIQIAAMAVRYVLELGPQ